MHFSLEAGAVKWLTIGLHLMPPYNWNIRQVADDIGAGIAMVYGWRKQREPEGLIIRKVEPNAEQSAEQIFTILPETASLSEYCCKILSISLNENKTDRQPAEASAAG